MTKSDLTDPTPVEDERDPERVRAFFEFAAEPKDLYADAVIFDNSDGVLRISFGYSRPGSDGALGYLATVPVARISVPIAVFRRAFREWLIETHGPDATL
jgi:hypothetical protein